VQAVELLPVQVISEQDFASELHKASDLLARRDVDDVALAALALKRRIPIWSNDRDYDNFPYGAYPTAQLLKMFGL
jgi:predicted nucleic acid-binding protein